MRVSLEWLGVSTYRLVVDELVIFLDAYIDRNPLAPPVGIQVSDVQRADYVLVGHSHFDHLWGPSASPIRRVPPLSAPTSR